MTSRSSIFGNLSGIIVGNGKYRVEELLGEGTFGVTYKAIEIDFNASVAIKFLKDNGLISDWKSEARRAATLRGVPQIATVILADEEDIEITGVIHHLRYIVSEFVDGVPLSKVIKNNPISTDMIVDITDEVCRAIGKMERKNLQHGDLHLGNILLLPPDELDPAKRHTIRIIDFGLARTNKKPDGNPDIENLKIILHDCWKLNQLYLDQQLVTDKKFHDLLSNLITRMEDPNVDVRITKPKEVIDHIYKIREESKSTKPELAKPLYNPFDYLNVEQIPEDSDLIEYLYADSVPWLKQITNFTTSVISGPRGSGKSMILKNMRLLTKIRAGNFDVESFKTLRYLGFYIHCNKNLYLPFAGYIENDDSTVEKLLHCLNLALTSEVLEALIQLEDQKIHKIEISQKNAIKDFLEENIFQQKIIVLNPDSILIQLKSLIEKEILLAHKMIKENSEITKQTKVGYLNSLVEKLDKIFDFCKDRVYYFLLDDYSSPKISNKLQQSINRIIGFRNSRFCFKITTEKFFFETTDLDGKNLQQDREYNYIDLGAKYINFNTPEREKFVEEIISKRLKRAEIKLSAIEFFGKTSGTSIAQLLITDNKSENEEIKFQYGGFKALYNLCMGDISTMLQLCNDLFTSAEAQNEQPRKNGISITLQNSVIKNFSKTRLETIKEIPVVGEKLYLIVETFGKISRHYLYDYEKEGKTVKYQEVLRIELTESTEKLSPNATALFKKLITEHIFLEAGGIHSWDKLGKLNPQLHLRPIYTPALKISYNSRYKLRMTCTLFNKFLNNPTEYEKTGTKFLQKLSGAPGVTMEDFIEPVDENGGHNVE